MISNFLSLKSVASIMAFNFMYVYGFTCIAFNEYRLANVTVDQEIDRVYRPTKFTDSPFNVLELLEGKKVTNSLQVDKIIHDIFWGETNSTSDECIQIEDLVELDDIEASSGFAFLEMSRSAQVGDQVEKLSLVSAQAAIQEFWLYIYSHDRLSLSYCDGKGLTLHFWFCIFGTLSDWRRNCKKYVNMQAAD